MNKITVLNRNIYFALLRGVKIFVRYLYLTYVYDVHILCRQVVLGTNLNLYASNLFLLIKTHCLYYSRCETNTFVFYIMIE